MTSHSKIAQFNWECIGRLKLKFTDWISRYSKRLKALELILYAQIFKLVRISFLYSPPISFLHIQSSYISSLRNYEVSCPAIFTSCAICLRGFKHSPLFLVFFCFVFMYPQSVVIFRARETNFGTNIEETGSVEIVLIPWDNSSFRILYLGQPWFAYRLLRADNIIRTFSFYWTEVSAFSNWSLESFWVWRLEDVDLLSSRVA